MSQIDHTQDQLIDDVQVPTGTLDDGMQGQEHTSSLEGANDIHSAMWDVDMGIMMDMLGTTQDDGHDHGYPDDIDEVMVQVRRRRVVVVAD